MWHEARKQEKKLRGLMVDYKKRAERRRNYYELIKKDPCSFLRLVGSNMKIHIDPGIAAAAEGPQSMMAWNGDASNMIDRFDVRAHLDYIPDHKPGSNLPDALEVEDDMKCNYDRYRIIVQNDCAGISEETALRQIEIDEKYGDVSKNIEQEEKKKSLSSKKMAIGFNYDTSEPESFSSSKHSKAAESSDEEPDDDFVDVDLDIAFDIDEISGELKQQLDIVATTFGMAVGEFAEQLRKDKEDEQELRAAKLAEQEKAAMSGRKSRRERRLYKETMLRLRGTSPPRYQAPGSNPRDSPKYNSRRRKSDSDSSRSPSPVADGLDFITNLAEDNSSSLSQDAVELPPHLRISAKINSSSAKSTWKEKLRDESPEFSRLGNEPSSASVKSGLETSPPLRRYRRTSLEKEKKDDSSSTSSSDDERSQGYYKSSGKLTSSATSQDLSYGLSSSKGSSSKTVSAQERLKKRMQAALNKTYKADKRTAEEKREQARKEQMERAEDLRVQAEEMRRREYMRRRHSSSSSRSRSRSKSPVKTEYRRSRSPRNSDTSREHFSAGSRNKDAPSGSRTYDYKHTSRYTRRSRSRSRSPSRYRSSHY